MNKETESEKLWAYYDRPISSLPICSKFFERLIYDEMFIFIK